MMRILRIQRRRRKNSDLVNFVSALKSWKDRGWKRNTSEWRKKGKYASKKRERPLPRPERAWSVCVLVKQHHGNIIFVCLFFIVHYSNHDII